MNNKVKKEEREEEKDIKILGQNFRESPSKEGLGQLQPLKGHTLTQLQPLLLLLQCLL